MLARLTETAGAWKTPEIISAVLLLATMVITLFSIVKSVGIKRKASRDPSMKGLFSICFMVIMSYSLIVFILLWNSQFPPDLITGGIIFLGACFCSVTVKFTNTLIKGFQREISRRKKLEDQLKSLSLIDEETGIYNYRGFLNLIEHHLLLAKRDSKGILICYVDIENFQNIKETLGHDEARMMVIETTKLLKVSFRTPDIIARISEDEFMVFLIGTDKEFAESIANRFREKLDAFNVKRNKKYKLPINFCMSSYDPAFNHVFENIHAQANDFMSAIKSVKKNPFVHIKPSPENRYV